MHMRLNIFNRRIRDVNALFNGHYVDVKSYYVMRFNVIPCIAYLGELDTASAFPVLEERLRSLVVDMYQHSYFDYHEGSMFANNTLFVLKEKRMVEITDSFCQVLHTPRQYGWGRDLLKELAAFKAVKEPRIIGFATNHDLN
jgi:hypothetical protein